MNGASGAPGIGWKLETDSQVQAAIYDEHEDGA